LLPVLESRGEKLDSRSKIGEVKGEKEDDEKEGNFKENTGKERANLFVNIRMGGMPRTYQRIKSTHINLLVKIFQILI